MTDQRFVLEMGMGNDLYGQDYTKAARRAMEDAMRHSTIPLFSALDIDHTEMRVSVTIGAQNPEAVDCDALAQHMPRGRADVRAVKGGLNSTNPDTGETSVICTAAIEAYLPYLGDRFS